MANFYNPYMKGIDWGQGLNQFGSQMLSTIEAKRYQNFLEKLLASQAGGASGGGMAAIDPSSVPTTATPEQMAPGAGGNAALPALNNLPKNLTLNEFKTIMAVLRHAGMGGAAGGFGGL